MSPAFSRPISSPSNGASKRSRPHFSSSVIPEEPTYVSDYTEFVKENLVAQSVHTAAPGFIGHMTSALPYFMLPLARLMTALNQNLVKVETSKAFTPMERQVLAMLHHLVYRRDDDFYPPGSTTASMPSAPSAPAAPSPTSPPSGWRATASSPRTGHFGGIAQEGLALLSETSRL